MKRHHKTPKMSRIRVGTFKKKMQARKIKKHPKCLASIMYKKCVTNNVIPKVEETNIKEVETAWGKIEVVKGNSEWKIPKNGFKQPKKLRKACKGVKHVYSFDKESGWTVKDVPYNYKSEYRDYTIPKMTRDEYKEALINEKMRKWEKKHPRPIKENDVQKDLFENEFLPKWNAERDLAVKRIRDFVVSMYDKLTLIGRYQISENKFEEREIAKIKDRTGEGNRINDLDQKNSVLLTKALNITGREHKKNKALICTMLKDHKKEKGRIILPIAA